MINTIINTIIKESWLKGKLVYKRKNESPVLYERKM